MLNLCRGKAEGWSAVYNGQSNQDFKPIEVLWEHQTNPSGLLKVLWEAWSKNPADYFNKPKARIQQAWKAVQ